MRSFARALLVLLFTASAWVNADAKAEFARSVQLFMQKDYAGSQALLARLIRSNPRNALYWFNFGNAVFMQEDYATAEHAFARVVQLKSPMAPVAQIYRAKALRQRGDVESARALLQKLLRNPDQKLTPSVRDLAASDLLDMQVSQNPIRARVLELYQSRQYQKALRLANTDKSDDADLRLLKALILIRMDREDVAHKILKSLQGSKTAELNSLVDSLLDRIRDNISKPKWLFAEFRGGLDSNIRKASATERGELLNFVLSGGARLWTQDLWQWNAGYLGSLNENPGHADLRVTSHELQTGIGREAGPDLFWFAPYMLHESWADKPVRLESGARLRVRGGTSRADWGTELSWGHVRALDKAQDYVAGDVTQVRFYTSRLLDTIYGQVFLNGERQALGNQTYSTGEVMPMGFYGWGPGVKGLWRWNSRWAADASLLYTWRDYQGRVQPTLDVRKDREFYGSLRLTRFFDGGIALHTILTWTDNKSTLQSEDLNQSYRGTQILAGGSWDAF